MVHLHLHRVIISYFLHAFLLTLISSVLCADALIEANPLVLSGSSSRVVRGFVNCKCSGTGRGYSREVFKHLLKGLRFAHKQRDKAKMQGVAEEDATRISKRFARRSFRRCVATYKHEACVNADVELRKQPGLSYCHYDRTTGKVLRFKIRGPPKLRGKFVSNVKCNSRPRFTSSDEFLAYGSPNNDSPQRTPPPKAPVQSPALSPSASPAPRKETDDQRENAKSKLENDIGKKKASGIVIEGESRGKDQINEGCVAIEHLTGYVMQYKKSFRKEVLCANAFCATPNHAIIVNGVWTSMKQMCGPLEQWKCTISVKLVNNLKVVANRRAKVTENIVITPYDLRYPKIVTWIVQILQDIATTLLTTAFATIPCLLVVGIRAYRASRPRMKSE